MTDRKRTKKVLAISGSSDTMKNEHEKSSRSANQKLFSYEYNSCDFGRQTAITSDSHKTPMRNNGYCKNHHAGLL